MAVGGPKEGIEKTFFLRATDTELWPPAISGGQHVMSLFDGWQLPAEWLNPLKTL